MLSFYLMIIIAIIFIIIVLLMIIIQHAHNKIKGYVMVEYPVHNDDGHETPSTEDEDDVIPTQMY